MTQNLLDNIRKLKNAVLAKDTLKSLCESAGEILKSTVAVISADAEVMAANESDYHNIIIRTRQQEGDIIYVESGQLKGLMLKPQENVTIASGKNKKDIYIAVFMPLSIKNEKIGLLAAYRESGNYNEEEIIILECVSFFAAQKIYAAKQQKKSEELKKTSAAKLAIETLSASELEAAKYILNELQGGEGLVVASKIADNAGITRSVIVNALRKIESAGTIEARSLGMKGTYIKIVNDALTDYLFKK